MKLPLIIFFIVLLASCANEPATDLDEAKEKLPDLHSKKIDSVYNLLSFQDKIKQLIWIEEKALNDSLAFAINQFNPGGIFTDQLDLNFIKSLPDSGHIQPFIGAYYKSFFDLSRFEFDHEELNCVADTFVLKGLIDSIGFYAKNFHINDLCYSDSIANSFFAEHLQKALNEQKLTHKTNSKSKFYFQSKGKNSKQLPVRLDTILIDSVSADSLTQFLRSSDILLVRNVSPKTVEKLSVWVQGLVNLKLVEEKDIEERVRKIIALKEERGVSFSPVKYDSLLAKVKVSLSRQAYSVKEHSLILVRNKKKEVPLLDWPEDPLKIIAIGDLDRKVLTSTGNNYADLNSIKTTIKGLDLSIAKTQPTIIFLNEKLDSASAGLLNDKVALYRSNNPIIVVNFSNVGNLNYLASVFTLIHVPVKDVHSESIAIQAVFGGVEINGRLKAGDQYITSKKSRLAYGEPEAEGFDIDSLKKIDKIVNEAIWAGVTPGCQVWAAKNGRVVYHRAYGFHTYDLNTIVRKEDVYDIASVTKSASTALAGMKLYEEGKYKIQDSLKDYLPDSLTRILKHKSRLSNITFKELYTHTSGMPAGLPIYQFIAYVDSVIGKFDRYYCDESNSYYCVEVARDFYLDSSYLDSLWLAMHNIWPGEKTYVYSDANFNILYQVLRRKMPEGKSYDEFLDSVYYNPMHLRTMGYLPLQNLDTLEHRIAPTEYDTYWRYQLLKGYVHDPNAALYGGVAGNAGLFSNANDLGVLFQMLLNGGTYGGKRYLKEETVRRFVTHQEGSHRGLGFDKPTGQSMNTVAPDCPITAFGHTGFTGACVWADPDNELVFVFLSNRVYPDPNNKKIITYGVRKRIHQVFYDQMK